jgi:hypothetical protein
MPKVVQVEGRGEALRKQLIQHLKDGAEVRCNNGSLWTELELAGVGLPVLELSELQSRWTATYPDGHSGMKFDATKLPVDLIPWRAVELVRRSVQDEPESFVPIQDLRDWAEYMVENLLQFTAGKEAGNADLDHLLGATHGVLALLAPSNDMNIPAPALEQVARVLELGARKYGPNSWQKVTPKERYLWAAWRHVMAWERGEELDPEFQTPHLAHAACCLLFLIHLETYHAQAAA